MLPKLIIHIGAPKCGSSSIQYFLARNHAALKAQNCHVPGNTLELDKDVTGEQVWFFQQFKDEIDKGAVLARERLNALLESLESPALAKIILSAENLSERQGFQRYFTGLKDIFDIQIVFYVRRQDEFLLSAWQQWHVKRAGDFWSWLLMNLAGQRKGDWYADIQPWLEAFGASAITVRRFGRQYFEDGDLINDFVEATGLSSYQLDLVVPRKNEGLNDEAVAFAHAMQDLFESVHDNEFYNMIRSWGGGKKTSGSSRLNGLQRLALLKHYEESNKKLKEQFFELPGDPGMLFEQPKAAKDQVPESEGVDANSELLMRLLFGAYKEIEALKAKKCQEIPGEKGRD